MPATVDVADSVSPSIVDVPDVTITVPPTTIQSWEVKGRSGQYKYSNSRLTPYPLPMIAAPSFNGDAAGRSWSQWTVEPLTNQPAGLFHGIPMLCHRRDGTVFTRWAYNQAGNTIEEAYLDRNRFAVFEGKRNCCATTGYTTYQGDPFHNGWWGLDKCVGWLFHIHGDGAIWTCAGDETPVVDGKIFYGERKRTGTFDKFWGVCTDFRISPGPAMPQVNPFACDHGNNRITKTVWTRTNSIVNSHTETYVEIPGVYSFDLAPDGTIFAASRTQGKIFEVSPNKIVKEIASGLTDINRVRLNSQQQIVWGAHDAKNLYHWNGTSSRLITNIAGASQAWWDFDIDKNGTCGPKDDIFATVSHTTPGSLIRVSFDGSYKSTGPNGGPIRTGRLNRSGYGNAITDPALHYGWASVVHPIDARIICAGFGDIAHTVWRRVRSNDPQSFNYNGYVAGRSQHEWGDTTFPSMVTLHGPRGFAYTGLKNFDELAYYTDADLDAYIKSGMEGTLNPRSFTAENLRNYRYFIRINSVRGVMETITY